MVSEDDLVSFWVGPACFQVRLLLVSGRLGPQNGCFFFDGKTLIKMDDLGGFWGLGVPLLFGNTQIKVQHHRFFHLFFFSKST